MVLLGGVGSRLSTRPKGSRSFGVLAHPVGDACLPQPRGLRGVGRGDLGRADPAAGLQPPVPYAAVRRLR
eukprot:15468962-Alexandrium_andersonii.AAC.1